jgi:hypothetical protein
MGSTAAVGSRSGRRAGGAWLLAVGLLVQGCAAATGGAPGPVGAAHPCGPDADSATVRTVDVAAAVMRRLVQDAGGAGSKLRVLYLVERPMPDPAGIDAGDQGDRTAPASSDPPFPGAVQRCLEGVRFAGLPAIRLVSGPEDPEIRRAPGRRPIPHVVDGRVVTLAPVPASGDRFRLAASSDGGGGLGVAGGVYVLERRGGAWLVTDQERAWIS